MDETNVEKRQDNMYIISCWLSCYELFERPSYFSSQDSTDKHHQFLPIQCMLFIALCFQRH